MVRSRTRAAAPPREDGDGRQAPRTRASPACRRVRARGSGRVQDVSRGDQGEKVRRPGDREGPEAPPSGRTRGSAVRARPGGPVPASRRGRGPGRSVGHGRDTSGMGRGGQSDAGRRGRAEGPRTSPPTDGRRPTTAASSAPPRRWAGGPRRHARGIEGHGKPENGWQDATMPRSFANTDGMAVAPGSSSYWDGSVRWVYREGGPAGPSRAPRGPWRCAARRARPWGPSRAADGAPSRPRPRRPRGGARGGAVPAVGDTAAPKGRPPPLAPRGRSGGRGGARRAGPAPPTAWNAPVVRPPPHTPPGPCPGGTGGPGGRGA